jgi:hypothetical protein
MINFLERLTVKLKRLRQAVRVLRMISKDVWKISGCPIIHWHLAGAFSQEDVLTIWDELHKAHKVYSTKLNLKYGKFIYNPGPDRKSPVQN